MKDSGPEKRKPTKAVKVTRKIGAMIGFAIVAAGFVIIWLASGRTDVPGTGSGDIKILKSEVNEVAKFYPYKAGNIKMEVLAVRAGDGTIRTALNTCQICYDSGRGYYEQQGDFLVCQNCGNMFHLDQVELVKGGCNPVPITKEDKTEDDTYIVIPLAFLEESKDLFANWKK